MEKFTDRIIDLLNEGKEGLVFLLWGAYAQRKGELQIGKHLILTSPHPSLFSAWGIFEVVHFRRLMTTEGGSNQ